MVDDARERDRRFRVYEEAPGFRPGLRYNDVMMIRSLIERKLNVKSRVESVYHMRAMVPTER
jgi:hypothetical protein